MISITTCPSCGGNTWTDHLSCKDYTVSHETFGLKSCDSCKLVITSPRPDDNQLSKYYQSADYISHSSKASSIIDKLYLFVRSFTLKWKQRLVDKHKSSSKTILDYGCGTGNFLKTCITYGWKVQGVEPSPAARATANENTNVTISEKLANDAQKFGIITMWHVLEHIPDFPELVTKLASKLENNGTLFIAVPNYKSYDAKHYKQFWAAYDAPRHLWHFSQHNIDSLMKKNGLQIKQIVPMKMDAFYVSLLSEKYQNDGKINIILFLKAIWIGLKSNMSGKKTGDFSSLIYIAKK